DHSRTACPTLSPVSNTIGFKSLSRAWAAAARPTGPAPITATNFAALDISLILLDIQKYSAKELRGGFSVHEDRLAVCFRAAFVDEEANQTAHDRIVGAADEGC